MRSFYWSLRVFLKRSKLTRDQYLMKCGQMVDYFVAHDMPLDPEKITREHVESFLADFAEGHKPATVQTRYKCLRPSSRSWSKRKKRAVIPWRT